MAHIMPQVALHRIIWQGFYLLKQNPDVLDEIFEYYNIEPMDRDYGPKYISNIKKWLVETEIPIVQAWSVNVQQAPQIAIRLSSESEDEGKAAIGDFFDAGDTGEIGVGVFTVNLDIQIMANKNSDEVLWLYYMVNYILFKRKRQAERLGLQISTFTATDNARETTRLPENIWSRTIKYRCVVQNFWETNPYLDISDMEVDVELEQVLIVHN